MHSYFIGEIEDGRKREKRVVDREREGEGEGEKERVRGGGPAVRCAGRANSREDGGRDRAMGM